LDPQVKDERQRQSGGRNGAIGEGCGHFLPSECPDELAAAILAFWRETRTAMIEP
jgi:pimeloyl-ACP methyl ester carboxylesterase